jgi:hypothetical protein
MDGTVSDMKLFQTVRLAHELVQFTKGINRGQASLARPAGVPALLDKLLVSTPDSIIAWPHMPALAPALH